MIYANVDENGRIELDRALKDAKDKNWYRRLKVIDLSNLGYSVPELSNMFDLHARTIRDYIHRYNGGGLSELAPRYGRGRKELLSWSKEQWLELMNQAPCQFDKLETGAQNWTQALMVDYLAAYHAVPVTQAAVSQMFKRVGIKWKRAKLRVQSPDPLYVVKRQRVESLKEKAANGSLTSSEATRPPPGLPRSACLVYLDSTDLHWCPEVGHAYSAQGIQTKVDSPGFEDPWLALFGSLVYPSGEGVYSIHEHKRHLELINHLQLLMNSMPDLFFFIVLDNASAHTTKKLEAFCDEHQDRFELVYLPTYSPHLNLIERLWRVMRHQVTRNQFFDSLDSLAIAVTSWLERYPFSQFCTLMGIDESEWQFV
jgi:transposase